MKKFVGGDVSKILKHFEIDKEAVAVLAISGADGKNTLGVYDDLFYIRTGSDTACFDGNVDPSSQRKGMATLLPMRVFHWRAGIHGLSRPPAKRYAAFVQAEPVTVMRYRQGADTGWFGINHHRGGVSSTSSLGCQTYKPDGWIAARNLLYGALGDTEQEVMEGSHSNCAFPYVVVPLDQADKILKGSATNPPGKSPTPKASVAWSLLLRDFPNQPNMVYGKAINVAGRLYVPVRDFCAQVIPCDPKDAPLEWTSGTAAGEVLKIEGKAVEDVMEIEEHAYVWIVEVAKALKLDILYIDAARNLVITPQ